MKLIEGWNALQSAGWLPRDVPCIAPHCDLQTDAACTDDFLGLIYQGWQLAFVRQIGAAQRRYGERICRWIDEQRRTGSFMTLAVPARTCDWSLPISSAVQSRLIFWTQGIPPGRWMGIVSSRMGRRIGEHHEWTAAFRSACRRAAEHDDVLITAQKTVAHRWVEPARELFGLRSLVIDEPPPRRPFRSWLQKLLSMKRPSEHGDASRAIVSPRIVVQNTVDCRDETIPWRDIAIAELADELVALHVRPGGNVERLIRARLLDRARNPASVYLAVGSPQFPPDLAAEFLKLGASRLDVESERPRCNGRGLEKHLPTVTAGILDSLPSSDWQYLFHCTRAQRGPWPDQSEGNYLRELLTSNQPERRTALASLQRIIELRRIIATGRLLRGRIPAVCLSAVPLSKLGSRNIYRPHQGRWDFEPYGLCLDRRWLGELGTRPVIYGTEEDWDQLHADDRPFFQQRWTTARRNGRTIDWSVENEWRHVGDIDLSEVPEHMAYVFVPSRREAETLSRISPWKIIVLDSAMSMSDLSDRSDLSDGSDL